MGNNSTRAAKWASFLAQRPEFPARHRFHAAFLAGRITRLCDCGCNSFDIEMPENTEVPSLASSGAYGAVFELQFRTEEESGSMEFTVFVDKDGHLAGVDVDYCANSRPVPDEPVLLEPPLHVRASASLDA